MMKTLGIGALFALAPLMATAQETCEPTTERHAYQIKGETDDGKLNAFLKPEIYGNHNFTQTLPNDWVFQLGAAKYGWKLYVLAPKTDGADADLTAANPPFRGAPNSRDIYGWHFRNAANTGPNEGDVNAPQEMRRFLFSPALIDKDLDTAAAPNPNDGRGWLNVIDYGLSDLAPGEKARMSYLKFDACLTWPKTDDEKQVEANNANPNFSEIDQEIYGSCGFDLAAYELHALITPRELAGDIDGDGSHDQIAQVRRKRDGRRGLALCRAGTWAHLIGMGTSIDGAPDFHFMPNMERWRFVPKTHGGFGYTGEPPWPEADGDVLVMERIEKEMALIYWKDGKLMSQQVYRFVEP